MLLKRNTFIFFWATCDTWYTWQLRLSIKDLAKNVNFCAKIRINAFVVIHNRLQVANRWKQTRMQCMACMASKIQSMVFFFVLCVWLLFFVSIHVWCHYNKRKRMNDILQNHTERNTGFALLSSLNSNINQNCLDLIGGPFNILEPYALAVSNVDM